MTIRSRPLKIIELKINNQDSQRHVTNLQDRHWFILKCLGGDLSADLFLKVGAECQLLALNLALVLNPALSLQMQTYFPHR